MTSEHGTPWPQDATRGRVRGPQFLSVAFASRCWVPGKLRRQIVHVIALVIAGAPVHVCSALWHAQHACQSVHLGKGQGILDALGLPHGGVLETCVSLRSTPCGLQSETTSRGVFNGASGVIRVTVGGHLSVQGLLFSGLPRDEGGGLRPAVFEVDGGTVIVSDSVFRHYSSAPVRVRSGSFTCTNCSFVENGVSSGVSIDSDVFEKEGGAGGCIQALGGDIVLERSFFANNWSPLGGGAIYIMGSRVLVSKCTFDSNACGHEDANVGRKSGLPVPCGGALLVEHDTDKAPTNVTMRFSSLRRNRAP